MREIRFRAWDTHNKIMMFSESYISVLLTYKLRGKEPPNGILMQFTGLHDSKRVEIYEGDIVSFGLYCNPMGTSYEIHKGEVKFKWGTFHIAYKSEWSDYPQEKPLDWFYYTKEAHYVSNRGNLFDRSEQPKNDVEVVGNIYENPELLKK